MDTPFYTIHENSLVGIEDANHNQILPCKFNSINILGDTSLFVARMWILQNRYGLYDFSGKEVFPCELSNIFLETHQGCQFIRIEKNGLCGLLDTNGSIILPCEYSFVAEIFSHELSYVEIIKNGKCGVFSYAEKRIVIPCIYNTIALRKESHFTFEILRMFDSLNAICNREEMTDLWDNKWMLVTTFQYFDIHNYNGYALAKNNGKNAFVDSQLNPVTPFEFEDVHVINDKYFWVKRDGKVGILDSKLQVLVPYSYEGDYSGEKFSDDLIPMKQNGKYGYVTKSGYVKIGFKFSEAHNFAWGKANVTIDGVKRVINTSGHFVDRKNTASNEDSCWSDYQQELHDDLVKDGLRDAFNLGLEDEVPVDWDEKI